MPIDVIQPDNPPLIDAQLREVLGKFPALQLALVFGSVAVGKQRPESDLDIAVMAEKPLTVEEKINIISVLAEKTGKYSFNPSTKITQPARV